MTDPHGSGGVQATLPFDAEAVVRAAGRALIVTDLEGTITTWNLEAERLFGWTADKVVGRPIGEVVVPAHLIGPADDIMATVRSGGTWHGEFWCTRKDGSPVPIHVVDSPVVGDDGRIVGIVGVSEDVTARRLMEAELRDNAEALRVSLAAGQLGTWRWDMASDRVVWDEQLERLFGLAPGGFDGTFEMWTALLHPEDRAKVLLTVDEALATGADYRLEHRVVWADGSVHWVQGRGSVTIGDDGRPSGTVGSVGDITDLMAARFRAEEAATQLAELARTLQAGLLPPLGHHPRVAITSRYRAGERRLLLGGDFLDAVATPDGRLGFCIGDVAGHGPGPAAVGAGLRAAWRALALGGGDPDSWLAGLARVLDATETSDELFVTVVTGTVDPAGRRLAIACAGHPAPIVLGAGADLLDVPVGAPLGVGGDLAPTTEVELPGGWSLLLVTDGLFEGRARPGAGERLGLPAVVEWLDDRGAPDLDELAAWAEAANGAPLEDDVALLLLQSL